MDEVLGFLGEKMLHYILYRQLLSIDISLRYECNPKRVNNNHPPPDKDAASSYPCTLNEMAKYINRGGY